MPDPLVDRVMRRATRELRMWRDAARLSLVGPGAPPRPPREAVTPRLHASRALLTRILEENIDPFWYPAAIDERAGGYRLDFEAGTGSAESPVRQIISQSRLLWYFARMARSGYSPDRNLGAARHGYEFLRDEMWDASAGGFFWEVDAARGPVRPNKHALAQAFGLFALSEYALASGEERAAALADEIFEVIEDRVRDAEFGGYHDFFTADWTTRITSGTPYFDNAVVEKSFSAQLHMLGALTVYHELRPEPPVRERLMELIVILSSTTLDRRTRMGTDRYLRDWTRARKRDALRVSYGHELERIWMLLGACQAAGIATKTVLGLVREVFEASCRFGYDRKSGGFYNSGRLGWPALDRRKFWWVQAEALVAACTLYRLTEDTQYAHRFLHTLRWIVRSQVDWHGGEWHRAIDERGVPEGPKADPWKTPYHNGRAMLLCLELLPAAD